MECKCYREPIGLSIVRNALGLREDLNHFEIVTEEMLENRQSPRGRGVKYDTRRRWLYQVAVASVDGFKDTGEAQRRRDALRLKEVYFSRITLFDTGRGARMPVQILRLSETFMESAARNLRDG